MALHYPSSTPRLDLSLRDSPPPPNSAPLIYQGGSCNGGKADVGTKTEVEDENLFTKLEKEGVEIDGKIASIIHDGISKIKAEAVR
ncbi:hypothetical protein HU200_016249 [Digitaria exilis]|uniref:Uncharacterized protein n=1 Tax=Digitaria exilis TaxID=1010633 RepID=A0A835KLQ8_9POAL|nr:hypothetical protein HU200_016249 [Digitaria exilis]